MEHAEFAKLEFLTLCGEYCIDPGIALEMVALAEAVAKNDMPEVNRILSQEF